MAVSNNKIYFHHQYLDQVVDWLISNVSPLSKVDPLSIYKGKGWLIYRKNLFDHSTQLSSEYVAEIENQNLQTAFILRFK